MGNWRIFTLLTSLGGGWTNPIEKYARQIASISGRIGVKMTKNVWNHHLDIVWWNIPIFDRKHIFVQGPFSILPECTSSIDWGGRPDHIYLKTKGYMGEDSDTQTSNTFFSRGPGEIYHLKL